MHFNIVTLFPEFFDSPLRTALMGRAWETGVISFSFFNPRDCALDKHRSVDDRPYGGGPGMVMMLEPLLRCLRRIEKPGRILVPSPGARPFTQSMARKLAAEARMTIVCGRYEGLDARLGELTPLEYASVGEAVINGGEAAALMMMEAVARLVPGFMGKEESGKEESFSQGLLEYPHYTRPDLVEGVSVPDVLRCGDHAKITAWRRERSLASTLRLRPELLEEAELGESDADFLRTMPRERLGRNLYLCLVHYPVLLKTKNPGASSLTNLDIHDIARNSCSYGIGSVYISTPLPDQAQILRGILHYWTQGAGAVSNPDRARALSLVYHVLEFADAAADIEKHTGQKPLMLGTSATWHKTPVYTPGRVREALASGPVLLLLGTSHGLAPEALAACDGHLRPLRFLDVYRRLSVRAATAAYLDRIVHDFY
ncbi:MAG: tRNA (guanosine(37)-N1)-methyltransferase TrmD [Deltaproteobacteria bacterium]|jgi:tRNA (guanine37-N1)-methyltransferase|nr:tRNA (guanosine(37)-N1)-methyltransferase TrmD [Deltaproteobacteria bacterium]